MKSSSCTRGELTKWVAGVGGGPLHLCGRGAGGSVVLHIGRGAVGQWGSSAVMY